jgi:hypothetical protein
MTRMSLPVHRVQALMTDSSLWDSSRPAIAGLDDQLLFWDSSCPAIAGLDDQLLLLGFFLSSNPRVPHISLVFREMWDSVNFNP